METSQLAHPRPPAGQNRSASLLGPIASIAFLGIVAVGIAWILLYPRELTVHGSVESLEQGTIAVFTLDGELERFEIDTDTDLPSNLEEGETVRVRYREVDGANVATEIDAVDGAAEPAAGADSP